MPPGKRNVTYHNPIHQEENTPLVTILETKIDTKQSTAVDSRQATYVIDLTKASFGGIYYPVPGTQWYLKKISGVWTLMARAARQNPQLSPSLNPVPGETYIGGEGKTYIMGDLEVFGEVTSGGSPDPYTEFHAVVELETDEAHTSIVDGDTFKRHIMRGNGVTEWGPGDATQDTNLYRHDEAQLATDGDIVLPDASAQQFIVGDPATTSTASFYVTHAAVGDDVLGARITGDSASRIVVEANGKIAWGGGSGAQDITLERHSADVLKLSDELLIERAATTDIALETMDNGDSVTRFKMNVSGAMEWGSGSATRDVVLERSAADQLRLNDELQVMRTTATGNAISARDDGDSVDRFMMDVSGAMSWGGGSGSRDVTLFRQAADTLRTEDTFQAAAFQKNFSGTYRNVVAHTGTASGTTDGSGYLTVTHGAGTTPIVVFCTGVNATSGADNMFMSSIDTIGATTFRVRLARSDGTTLNTKSVNVQYVCWVYTGS